MLIASAGQTSTHTPQSTHALMSTCALSSAIFIASLGHSDTQDSQPVQVCLSTLAGIFKTFPKQPKNQPVKSNNVTKSLFYYNINFRKSAKGCKIAFVVTAGERYYKLQMAVPDLKET
jgi:hypothetical protein